MWRVADLFCGAGGFSEGFRQAGFEIAFAVDNWNPAVRTFRANHPGAHVVRADVFSLSRSTLPEVDVVIGSPPCTPFSHSNGTNHADRLQGQRLVLKFFDLVRTMRPKVWVMENVPPLARWISPDVAPLPIPQRQLLNAADFGVPQRRLRLFWGDYPRPVRTHRKLCERDAAGASSDTCPPWRSMGAVLDRLPRLDAPLAGSVRDPLYNLTIPIRRLEDHFHSTWLSAHQVERNRQWKTNHPWCGFMQFPDDPHSPARTVMATQIPGARETIVLSSMAGTTPGYRMLTARECATLQSFPLTYKFMGKTIREKYRLVGNAVPPFLSRAIARAILTNRDSRAYEYSPKATP